MTDALNTDFAGSRPISSSVATPHHIFVAAIEDGVGADFAVVQRFTQLGASVRSTNGRSYFDMGIIVDYSRTLNFLAVKDGKREVRSV